MSSEYNALHQATNEGTGYLRVDKHYGTMEFVGDLVREITEYIIMKYRVRIVSENCDIRIGRGIYESHHKVLAPDDRTNRLGSTESLEFRVPVAAHP